MAAESYKIPEFRIQLVKEGEGTEYQMRNAEDVVKLAEEYAMWDREVFVCFHLNTKNIVVGKELVSMGTLNHSVVHPREIFKAAILANSAGIILCHNHPSGNPNPSSEDNSVTKRIAKAASIMGITFLDHVIVGPIGHFYSYNEENPEILRVE